MNSKITKPRFFVTKYERHLIMSHEYMVNLGVEKILDILLDYGFTTKLELTRFDDDEQNIVEFVQDLDIGQERLENDDSIKFKSIYDVEPGGEDNYH